MSCCFVPKWALSTMVVLPIATLCITYPMSDIDGKIDTPFSFISATIDYPPAQCVGTFGLGLTSGAYVAVSVIRHAFVATFFESAEAISASGGGAGGVTWGSGSRNVVSDPSSVAFARYWLRYNFRALCVALVGALGGIGVVSFQWHNANMIHNCCAAVFFFSGIAFQWMQTSIDYGMMQVTRTVPRAALPPGFASRVPTGNLVLLRRCIAVISMLGVAGYITLLVAHYWHQKEIQKIAAVCEVTAFMAFIIHMATYAPLFSRLRATVVVEVADSGAKRQSRAEFLLSDHATDNGDGIGHIGTM